MSKVKKIRREVTIGGVKRWISGNTEQEYAEKLIAALHLDGTPQFVQRKHEFQKYAQQWFEVFSKPNVELVTATTYERQLRVHIYPILGELPVEEIAPVDVQKVFNAMSCAKETKIKVKNILNMIFEQAIEDGLIQRNPLHSRSIRITGKSSTPIKPYTVEQMRYLVQHIADVKKPMDRNYLALHTLHPLRPEEILGLQWQDIDFAEQTIRIERAVTHPHRNEPLLKGTKTDASRRVIDLVPQIIPYLTRSTGEHFVLGGEKPLTYTQTRKMCQRIQQDINFAEAITPRRFRTTVLTDLYDMTKDIKQAQAAAGHTTAAMTLKHYVKGRSEHRNTAAPIASAYGLEN